MPGELEAVLREMFTALDRKDADALMRTAADDMQSVDEISRRWLRGSDEVGTYIRETLGQIETVKTEIREVHEHVWGDAGLLTCWIDQDYTFQGQAQHVSAPTTAVFRREAGEWRIALFHSIPLPEGDT